MPSFPCFLVVCEEPCRELAWRFCLHLTSQLPAVGAPLGPGPRVLAAELDPWGGGVSGASVALGASTRRALIWEGGGLSRPVVQGFLGCQPLHAQGPPVLGGADTLLRSSRAPGQTFLPGAPCALHSSA